MELINGRQIAAELRAELKQRQTKEQVPQLAIIVAQDQLESLYYIGLKEKAVRDIGGESQRIVFSSQTAYEQLLDVITQLNRDDSIDGILLQLPLPPSLARWQEKLLLHIDPVKDVDGFHPVNRGLLVGPQEPHYIGCAVLAVLEVIKRYQPFLKGKNVVLIGDSFDLILPLAVCLIKLDYSVTVITEYKLGMSLSADILVVEKGYPYMFTGENIANQGLVIDAGFYWQNNQVCGNIDLDSLNGIQGYLLPVPGGLGPILIAKLVDNLCLASARRKQ